MRIASFNVENLFSRAKVLNFRNNDTIAEKLAVIGQLQDKLQEDVYDKSGILALYKQVSDFIEIQENKGKLFKRSGRKITGIAANGRNDWDGTVAFKREDFSQMARSVTARVIKEMKPDIVSLVEVEDRLTLKDFCGALLSTSPNKFPYNICIDGNDPRGIDVALLSKFPIKNLRTHIFDKETPQSRSYVFSRDCLEIELEISAGNSLHILCNHLKSKLSTSAGDSGNSRRKMQAQQIAKILTTNYDLSKDLVIVAGDFNDTPDSAPLKPLLKTPNLFDVLQLQFGDDRFKRWSYFYQSQYNQIDYILVSKPLKEKFKAAGVERGGLFDIEKQTKAGEKRFKEITTYKDAASDHAGIWAEFDL